MSWALIPLTEEQREIQSTAREFARAEIAPNSVAWDRDSYFDRSLIGKMGELGFLGMMLPEEYGGLALPTTTYLVALEEIAASDASVAVTMNALMPRAPRRSDGVSVRAITISTSASLPLVTHALVPLITQQSPSRTACDVSDAASDPASGSDSANAPSSSPRAIGARKRSF